MRLSRLSYQLYGIKKSTVLFTSTAFLTGNILVSIAVLPIVRRFGLSWSLTGSVLLACGGTAIRLLSDEWFDSLLIGQFLLGISACFIVNTVMQFCFTWFSPKDRPLYLSVASVMNIFGGGIGNTLPLIFLNNDEEDVDVIKRCFHTYNYTIFGVMTGLAIITFIFFREKPPKGYGYVNRPSGEDFFKGVGSNFLKNNYKFLKLSLGFSLFRTYLFVYVITNSFLVFMGSVINLVLLSLGYTSFVGSLTAFLVIFFGLISSITYSLTLIRYKNQSLFQHYYLSIG